VRRMREGDQFLPMSLATVEAVGRHSRPFLVLAYALHIAQTTKSLSFPLPSAWLRERGVNRKDERCALRELEAGGVISVEWLRTPVVTMIVPPGRSLCGD
jgi:hypothetical protein